MKLRPPVSTRTDTLFPDTTLVLSLGQPLAEGAHHPGDGGFLVVAGQQHGDARGVCLPGGCQRCLLLVNHVARHAVLPACCRILGGLLLRSSQTRLNNSLTTAGMRQGSISAGRDTVVPVAGDGPAREPRSATWAEIGRAHV